MFRKTKSEAAVDIGMQWILILEANQQLLQSHQMQMHLLRTQTHSYIIHIANTTAKSMFASTWFAELY